MLTVEEALEQILSRIPPLGTELVELTAALGRVLAEPTVSCRELPPWPNSSMDGYAVRADDTRAGGVDRKSTRLNSSHLVISYAVFCLKKKKTVTRHDVVQ